MTDHVLSPSAFVGAPAIPASVPPAPAAPAFGTAETTKALDMHTLDGILGALVWGLVFGGGVLLLVVAGIYHTYMNLFGS